MPSDLCPSVSDLDRLLSDQLPPDDVRRLENHVAGCSSCADALQRLEADDTLIDELRRGRALAMICNDADVARLLDRLRRLTAPNAAGAPAETAPSAAGRSDTPTEGRNYLAPADAPEELGRLGPYRILKMLGVGGMGIVYQARQDRPRRLVALKMILADPGIGRRRRDRFQAETEVVARLQHPNIIQIHEVGEHQGLPYFTMEFAAGGNLAQRLAQAPLAPRPAAELVEALARAAHFAHEQGFVHRDLKPSNILLTQFQSPKPEVQSPPAGPWTLDLGLWTPKIADFGLAKQFEADSDETGIGQPTESGALLGTANYMAPEQASGRCREVGPAADVYALGAILYEALTGRPPFRAATVLDTLELVRTQEPVPPTRLQPHLPRDLQTICLKCLEKDLRRRYPSARHLADDLGRFVRNEPIQARPVSTQERLGKWVRRKPALAALVGVSALSLVIFVAGVLIYDARLRVAFRDTEASAAEALEQQRRARASYQQARETINQMLARAQAERFPGVPVVRQLGQELHEDALAFFQGIFREAENPDPAVQFDVATAYLQAASIQLGMGQGDAGYDSYQHARALLEALASRFADNQQYRQSLGQCYLQLGVATTVRGNLGEGETCYGQSLDLFEQLGNDAWHKRPTPPFSPGAALFDCLTERSKLLAAAPTRGYYRAFRPRLASLSRRVPSVPAGMIGREQAEVRRNRGRDARQSPGTPPRTDSPGRLGSVRGFVRTPSLLLGQAAGVAGGRCRRSRARCLHDPLPETPRISVRSTG
jgi:serine/threonine protein kinase